MVDLVVSNWLLQVCYDDEGVYALALVVGFSSFHALQKVGGGCVDLGSGDVQKRAGRRTQGRRTVPLGNAYGDVHVG